MTNEHDPATDPEESLDPRDLLARTMAFLEQCQDDPALAFGNDDPALLVQGLRALLGEDEGEPPIDFHRRKSA